jgi:LPS export ABC transporter protein LptC
MTSWQKRARLVVAALGLAVVVVVALTVRHRQAPAPPAPVTRLDPNAVSQSSGARVIQSTGNKLPGVLDSEHTLLYADGSSKVIKPKFTKDRNGVPYVVTSNEARVGPDQSSMVMTGDVHLVSGDGLDVKTGGEASYARSEGILRAPGPVSFAKGTMSGTSVGMTYDEKQDLLWLLDKAVVKVAPSEKTGQGAEVVAGAAAYARKDNYMRFERTVRITREGRVVSAETATAFLAEDGNTLQSLELRGNSVITATGAVAGGLQAMRARDMNLTYGPDGETLERAVLSGDAAIQLAGDAGKPGRRIAGEFLDVAFGSAGEVTSLAARDRVELKIPADSGAPERVIRAASMDGTGEAGKGLTGARFEENVEFREARGPGEVRRARAKALEVAMAAGSGDIQEARFTGGTRFEDGSLRASALDGRYQIAKGVLELTGVDNGVDPRVQDERVTVDATRIDLTFEGTKLVAAGEVRSLLKPAREASERKSPRGTKAAAKARTASPRSACPGSSRTTSP